MRRQLINKDVLPLKECWALIRAKQAAYVPFSRDHVMTVDGAVFARKLQSFYVRIPLFSLGTYLACSIKSRPFLVHRLVYLTFHDKWGKGACQIRHVNGNNHDNHLSNLTEKKKSEALLCPFQKAYRKERRDLFAKLRLLKPKHLSWREFAKKLRINHVDFHRLKSGQKISWKAMAALNKWVN